MGNCFRLFNKSPNDNLSNFKIQMKCWTSCKLLFDFESSMLSYENLVIENSTALITEGNKIISEKIQNFIESTNINNDSEINIKIEKNENDTIIISSLDEDPLQEKTDNSIWRVLRKFTSLNDEIEIKKGDIIRLGLFPFLIKTIVINNNNQLNNFLPKYENNSPSSLLSIDKSLHDKWLAPDAILCESILCRICLSSAETNDNKLISPCKCSGSMRYIHLNCLKTWIENNVETNSDKNIIILSWKELKCELCKSNLKNKIHLKNDIINPFNFIPRNFKNYLILETLKFDSENKKHFFICNLDKAENFLGRYHDCDIKINDNSVSRYHAKIRKEKQKVFIQDLEAKFGTFILLKNPLVLKKNKNIDEYIMYRRSIIHIFCNKI